MSADAIAKWFDNHGFQGLSEAISEYPTAGWESPARFIRHLSADLAQCETVHDDDPDPDVYATAWAHVDTLREILR